MGAPTRDPREHTFGRCDLRSDGKASACDPNPACTDADVPSRTFTLDGRIARRAGDLCSILGGWPRGDAHLRSAFPVARSRSWLCLYNHRDPDRASLVGKWWCSPPQCIRLSRRDGTIYLDCNGAADFDDAVKRHISLESEFALG